MTKKLLNVLLLLFLFAPSNWASSSREEFFQNNLTRVSIYSPEERLGFNGEIVTLAFSNVQDGPSDHHFSLASSRTGSVKNNSLAFTDHTVYENHTRRQTHTFPLQRQIKENISAYGVARLTFDSYQAQCNNLGTPRALNSLQVTLNPHDQVCTVGPKNAYYLRTGHQGGQGVINFCSRGLTTSKIFDITAHEVGHSILDVLNPAFYDKPKTHVYSALHESFGDLSAYFASIRLAALCNSEALPFFMEINDLCLAPAFNGRDTCLRYPSSYQGASCEAHDHSNYFTAFSLNIMRETFKLFEYTSANAVWTSNFFQGLLTRSVMTTGSFETLYDFGKFMQKQVPLLLIDSSLALDIINIMEIELNANFPALHSCGLSPYARRYALAYNS